MPDLGELNDTPVSAELMSFSYDNTLDEVDGAMKTFQKRFSGKRGVILIAAYSLFCAAVVAAIFLNPTSVLAYAALAFCLLGLFYSATDKKRTRKKTIEALKDMNPEEYKATVFDDRIELETIVKPKANEVSLKIDEQSDEEIISPLKSVFRFGEELLDLGENDESILLFYNRRQIYCFPKRCLSPEQEEQLKSLLQEKIGR